MVRWCLSSLIFLYLTVSVTSCPVSLNRTGTSLDITKEQSRILARFKASVLPILPQEYMKEDNYLVRWLIAKDFDLQRAERMLINNLEWRQRNRMDSILDEDWSDMEKEYRVDVEGCDREGRPVMSVQVGTWDVRKATLTTRKTKRLMRFFDKYYEHSAFLIRKANEQGENMTQFDVIFDMSEFTPAKQGCLACIPPYVYWFLSFQAHYPLCFHRTVLVNVPPAFLNLYEGLSTLLSKRTQDAIALYGADDEEWKSALQEFIEPRHLSKRFGGLRNRPTSLEEVKKIGNFKCSQFQ